MPRLNQLATDQASVLATALMSAEQVAKRGEALPETSVPETNILQPCRTYRLSTSETVELPDITDVMDGAKIKVIQLSGSSTISFGATSMTLDAALNPNGGVQVTFVARYIAAPGTSIWYAESEPFGIGTFPTLIPATAITGFVPYSIGVIAGDGTILQAKGPLEWTVHHSPSNPGSYSLHFETEGDFIVVGFTAVAFTPAVENYGGGTVVCIQHDSEGLFVSSINLGSLYNVATYGMDGSGNGDGIDTQWGFVAYKVA